MNLTHFRGTIAVLCLSLSLAGCSATRSTGSSASEGNGAGVMSSAEAKDLYDQQRINALKNALKQNPNDADIYYHLGLIEAQRGDWPGALKAFKETVKIDPNDVRAYYRLGLTWEKSSEIYVVGTGAMVPYAQRLLAIEAYQNAIKIDQDYTDAYYRLGILALMEENVPLAKKAIDGLARLEPHSERLDTLLKRIGGFSGSNWKKIVTQP